MRFQKFYSPRLDELKAQVIIDIFNDECFEVDLPRRRSSCDIRVLLFYFIFLA